jgi:hypothetical protein
VRVIPATSDSDFGDAAVKMSPFNFLNGVNRSEPNAADEAQNESFYYLLTADTQSEFNRRGTARNVLTIVCDGNLTATRIVARKGCKVLCKHSVCHVRCDKDG